MLISSILTNSEVWYGVTQADIEQLEQIDEMWMRNLFKCSQNVPKDLLYLMIIYIFYGTNELIKKQR